MLTTHNMQDASELCEVDDHIAGYLFVTVLGKEGYLLASGWP
nr:hypothetical protein [Blautia pseudococcoides]